jgi:hypothetical protein
MGLHADHDHFPWAAQRSQRDPPRARVAFDFDGALDEVPTDAAAELAVTAHALLKHGDEHRGGRCATVRVARLGSLLNLWFSDPECSAACLARSGHLPSIHPGDVVRTGAARLTVDDLPEGGLRVHWMRVLDLPVGANEPRTNRASHLSWAAR